MWSRGRIKGVCLLFVSGMVWTMPGLAQDWPTVAPPLAPTSAMTEPIRHNLMKHESRGEAALKIEGWTDLHRAFERPMRMPGTPGPNGHDQDPTRDQEALSALSF